MKVVLSSIPSDSHTWNLMYMQLLLEEMGYEVVNLGSCTPVEDIISGVRDHQPDALVISTVNGHGMAEGAKITGQLHSLGLADDVPKLIGGNLATTGSLTPEQVSCLRASFDGVFTGERAVDDFIAFMNHSSRPHQAAN